MLVSHGRLSVEPVTDFKRRKKAFSVHQNPISSQVFSSVKKKKKKISEGQKVLGRISGLSVSVTHRTRRRNRAGIALTLRNRAKCVISV